MSVNVGWIWETIWLHRFTVPEMRREHLTYYPSSIISRERKAPRGYSLHYKALRVPFEAGNSATLFTNAGFSSCFSVYDSLSAPLDNYITLATQSLRCWLYYYWFNYDLITVPSRRFWDEQCQLTRCTPLVLAEWPDSYVLSVQFPLMIGNELAVNFGQNW